MPGALGVKSKKKRRPAEEAKEILWEYFENKCGYCAATKNLHLHHKIPLYAGGRSVLHNVELVCPKCHFALHLQINKIYPFKPIRKMTKPCYDPNKITR